MNIDNLLKRIEIFLSEGNFRAAKEYCERVLDEDVENAQAYIFALMIELKLTDIDMLKYVSVNLNNYPNFVKALKYGNFEQKNYLTACRDTVLYKIEKKQKETERASLQESLDNDKLMLAELEIERNRIADYLLVFDKLYKSLNIVAFVWYLLVGFMICSIVLTVQNNNFLIMLIISIKKLKSKGLYRINSMQVYGERMKWKKIQKLLIGILKMFYKIMLMCKTFWGINILKEKV